MIAHDLYMLAAHPATGRERSANNVAYVVRAGLLAELLVRGQLVDNAGRAEVTPAGASNPVLDRIRSSRPRKWVYWAGKDTKQALAAVRAELVADGRVSAEPARILGVIAWTRYRVADVSEIARMRARVDSTLAVPSRAGDADAALVALGAAARLRDVFGRRRRKECRGSLSELGRRIAPLPMALRRALDAHNSSTGAAA